VPRVGTGGSHFRAVPFLSIHRISKKNIDNMLHNEELCL